MCKHQKLVMGGKGRIKKATTMPQSSGKKRGNVNSKTICKLDHLKSIAKWTAIEASIPSLGSFLGERLAATTEALGLKSDPQSFICERCESILQPGSNCTVRIESNKKCNPTTQNSVVYRCHLCSHRNLVKGTSKNYLKSLSPPAPKAKPPVKVNAVSPPPPISGGQCMGQATSPVSLLDSKRRKRNRSSGMKSVAAVSETAPNTGEDEGTCKKGSTNRRRKSWTSLKEIAENISNSKNLTTDIITVPFFL